MNTTPTTVRIALGGQIVIEQNPSLPPMTSVRQWLRCPVAIEDGLSYADLVKMFFRQGIQSQLLEITTDEEHEHLATALQYVDSLDCSILIPEEDENLNDYLIRNLQHFVPQYSY